MEDIAFFHMPAGISFADRSREQYGDYMELAFLGYHSETISWRDNPMTDATRKLIEAEAAEYIRNRK